MKHNILTIFIALSLVPAVACFSGCGSKAKEAQKDKTAAGTEKKPVHGLTAEQAAKVLVKVGDTTITVGQFAERLATQSPYLRARYQNADRRREFLDNMVEFELLAIEAKKQGFDKKPDVERAKKQKMVQKLMKSLFDEKGGQVSDVTEAEISAYFDRHKDEYQKPEQVRASHILFKDKALGQRVLKQLLAAPEDMQLFRKLAEQYNQDPTTRDRAGDLRFFSRPDQKAKDESDVPDAVRVAAFALKKIGDLHGSLVESPQGLHIVKLTGKRDAYTRTLEEARRSIQNRIWRERREKAIDTFVNELREKANVQENLALLDQVQVPAVPAPVEEPKKTGRGSAIGPKGPYPGERTPPHGPAHQSKGL
jgi:peptidyl-prolyl cis-trans isomerase C